MYFLFNIALLCLLTLNNYSQVFQDSVRIQLIQQAWHVGFLIPVDSISIAQIPVLNNFKEYRYVDIGWGDEDFYQNDGINYFYAAKAILIPSSSVVKITGHLADEESILRWAEESRMLILEKEGYEKLLSFIQSSLIKDENGYIETSRKADGAIRFYKSNLNYHLFNTCNNWIADGLREGGLPIDDESIITKEELFEVVDRLKQK